MKRVAIIGGGPGGLMTARLLERRLGPSGQITLFEASDRLGGKIQSRRFDSAPVIYEAGVAECYAYDTIGPDPLRQLVEELGLKAVPTSSTAVVLNGALLRDESDIATHCGGGTSRGIQNFRQQAVAMLPLASWYRGFGPEDNRHPWAALTFADILEQVEDPVARQYLKVVPTATSQPSRISSMG